MKFSNLLLTFLLMCWFPIHSQPRKPESSPTARQKDMLNAIKQLEEEMRKALLQGNATWWATYLSDEYSETDPSGKLRSKNEAVEMYRSKDLICDSLNLSDRTVRTFNGDTVIVTGKMTIDGTRQGQKLDGDYEFTRVWIKQGLEWKLAAFEWTRIAQ